MPVVKVNTWTAMNGQNQPVGDPIDVEVHYETYGDESAPPLLLINGVGMPLAFFTTEFCEALAASGPYWVIAYDARDCGTSTKIDQAGEAQFVKLVGQKTAGIKVDRSYGVPYMLSELASDAVGLLDVLGVESAHLVGFSSLGCATVQRLLIEHSSRVSSISLISGGTAEPGMAAADSDAQKAMLETTGDPLADALSAGRIVCTPKFFDEAKAKEIVQSVIDPVAKTGVYMKRQACALLAEQSRVQELQKASSELPRDPSCSRGPIICQLTGSEKMPAPSATEKSFTALICEVKREGSDEVLNTLKSRYSAFLDVKDKLEANSIWKAQVSPIPFPPKSVFGRFESAIIKDRIEGITAWLNTVLAIPNLKDCYEICGFLGVPAGDASPCVVIAGAEDKLMKLDHAYSCCRSLVGAELVVIEGMAHEILGIPPPLFEQVLGSIKSATLKAGRPAAKKA